MPHPDVDGQRLYYEDPRWSFTGSRTPRSPVDVARDMAQGLPNAEFVAIAGAGHAANLGQPGEFNPHLARILASL
jgi:pimeloyl-ACP methyl ester carboxylesterase